MSTNCLRNTIISDAVENAANFSDKFKQQFFAAVEEVDSLIQAGKIDYSLSIRNFYKNGDVNGEIIIDTANKRYLFIRFCGWFILPFSAGEQLFEELKQKYFSRIELFDKKYEKYIQSVFTA